MLPSFPTSFFAELRRLPHEQVSYEAGLRIAALRPGRHVLETDECGGFDLDEALTRGLFEGRLVASTRPQILRRYYEATEETDARVENAIHAFSFEGCTIEVVTVSFQEGDCTSTRHFVVAPDADLAERFFLSVSRLAASVERELMVFQNGRWERDAKLLEAASRARLEDLVLRGALLDELVADVRGFFAAREIYERYRIPFKRGILLYGPPGNGKTHFLKALLATLEVPCLYVKSLVNQRHDDHDALRRIFLRARRAAPCLLVLEDLDTIVSDGNRSFFLNELDGFADNTGVAVLATTNYPEKIDPSIIDRPSRFDRKYCFDLPSTEERLAFLERWASGLEPEMRPSRDRLARTADKTRSFSFAYLKELTVSATMAWARTARPGSMDAVLEDVTATLKEQAQRGRSPTASGSRRLGLIPEA